jgi:hypothetical protein
MISRPSSLRRLDPFEPELSESKRIDERVDHSNRIVLVDPVVKAFRKQRRLSAIRPLNEALHPIPRKPQWNHIMRGVFTHPGSWAALRRGAPSVRSTFGTGHHVTIYLTKAVPR